MFKKIANYFGFGYKKIDHGLLDALEFERLAHTRRIVMDCYLEAIGGQEKICIKTNPKLYSIAQLSPVEACVALNIMYKDLNPDLFMKKLKEYCKGDRWCTNKRRILNKARSRYKDTKFNANKQSA
jgi:hypothetical protein